MGEKEFYQNPSPEASLKTGVLRGGWLVRFSGGCFGGGVCVWFCFCLFGWFCLLVVWGLGFLFGLFLGGCFVLVVVVAVLLFSVWLGWWGVVVFGWFFWGWVIWGCFFWGAYNQVFWMQPNPILKMLLSGTTLTAKDKKGLKQNQSHQSAALPKAVVFFLGGKWNSYLVRRHVDPQIQFSYWSYVLGSCSPPNKTEEKGEV